MSETYHIGTSEYESKLIKKHERKGHTVISLVMRRRLSLEDRPGGSGGYGNVVYWSWNLCECGWNCHGRVTMRNESAQGDFFA